MWKTFISLCVWQVNCKAFLSLVSTHITTTVEGIHRHLLAVVLRTRTIAVQRCPICFSPSKTAYDDGVLSDITVRSPGCSDVLHYPAHSTTLILRASGSVDQVKIADKSAQYVD